MSYISPIRAGFDPRRVPAQQVALDASHPLSQGLVGCWTFSSESVVNLCKPVATTVLGASAVSGPNGAALSFNGTSSSYVDTNDATLLDAAQNLSIECWVKLSSAFQAFPVFLAKTPIVDELGANYCLNAGNGGNKIEWNQGAKNISTGILATGVWYHIVVTNNATANNIYINGVLDSTFAACAAPASTAATWKMGSWLAGSGGLYLDGGISGPKIWNRALSAGEVAQLYNGTFSMLRPVVRRQYYGVAASSGAITGTAAIVSAATGTLTGFGALSGTAAIVSTATGTLTSGGALTGTAAAVSTATGTLTGSGALSGTAAIVSTATGTLADAGSGALTGTSAIVSTASGTLTGFGALTGTAAIVSTATGTLTVPGAITGTAAIVSTATATLTGRGALSATAAIISTATGTLVVPTAIGTATALTVSISAKTKAIYAAAAADAYRALITTAPGAGPVLGVVAMAFAGVDHVYAFRGNVGNTAALLYKASTSGWVLVPYYNLVSFTGGGTATPPDGDTLTQGGVTATIKRVMSQSGAWTGSAVGQFVVTDPAGGNFAAGAATTTSGATVTLSGAQTPITMASDGRFEFEKCNFSGQLITRRIYGCDGVNPAFEFDGETLAPIATGLSPDRPSHIRFHKNFLFVSQESSIFYSAAGNPFKWSAVDGAGEIATGDIVTGMITLPGSQTTATLAVFLRTNTAFLYGTDPTTFNFVTFNSGIGAVPWSIQNLFDSFVLDDLGVVTLKTTLNYGNFLPSTLTKNILPFIQRERGNLTASSVNREKSQYRLFFGDGYALYCTVLNQQYLGAMPALYPAVIKCTDTTKLVTDNEATYAGAADGYVYQLDVGTSFDGAVIPAYFVTAWDPVRSPRILKRFRAASLEVQGGDYAEIGYGYQLGYNSDQIPQLAATTLPLNLGAVPHWDSFVWDAFVWDGSGLSPTDIDETGTAENIRVTITSGTNYIGSYTVNSILHQYTMRRGMRV